MSDVEQWEHDEQRAMETEIAILRGQVSTLTAAYENAVAQHNKTLDELRASHASAPEGFTMSEPTILPDGSGFGTMSFPLPKDHWIYKEREYEEGAIEPNDLPAPILTNGVTCRKSPSSVPLLIVPKLSERG